VEDGEHITSLLARWPWRRARAPNESCLRSVYAEMRRIAQFHMGAERSRPHPSRATALVHEATFRLVAQVG